MAWVAALKAHTIRKPPSTPPDLWTGTPLVQQEAFLTFLINQGYKGYKEVGLQPENLADRLPYQQPGPM
eukprot:719957-Pelagomonas_calceolata.AAC.1